MTRNPKSGFTLLEMMISFVILTIAITGIYKVLSTGITQSSEQFLRYEATEIAISMISELEVTRPPMPSEGRIGGKWHWSARIEPLSLAEVLPPAIRFNQLTVEVFTASKATPIVALSQILPAELIR